MNNSSIDVFVTGGTFDKNYNLINGELHFENSSVSSMFERGRSQLPLNVKTLMMVDSLEMTTSHRDIILMLVKNLKTIEC